tara:strand:- start:1380 stop:3119 length:1740 start_codon:yes stop_codon:yes gene_type:complete
MALGTNLGILAQSGAGVVSDPALILKYATTTTNEDIEVKGAGAGYNYDVDWGDGSSDTGVTTTTKTHTYSAAGTYTVKITGTFPQPYFGTMSTTNRNKIVELSNWGDIPYTKLFQAFAYCINMDYTATDTPNLSAATANTSNMMRSLFQNCEGITSAMDLSNWTDLECVGSYGVFLFLSGADNVPSINMSGWNMPNVTNANQMLYEVGRTATDGCDFILDNMTFGKITGINSFMQSSKIKSLSMDNWTLPASNTCQMKSVFYNTTADTAGSIALDLSGWSNTNNITDMTNFMRANSTTNSPFSSLNTTGWNTSGVTKLDYAFLRAAFLTEIVGLSGWKGDSVTSMTSTFQNTHKLNFTNHNFDTTLWGAALTNLAGSMASCFADCGKNNLGTAPNLTNWYVNNVTTMSNMFYNAGFSTSINVSTWNFGSTTTLSGAFRNVTGMTTMTFNNISSACTNFGSKFRDADDLTTVVYNSNCDLSGVTTYTHYAYSANNLATQTFDASVSFVAVTTFLNAWTLTSLNTTSYDQILIRSEATNSNTLTLSAPTAQYTKATSAAATARAALIADHSWTINDDGPTP